MLVIPCPGLEEGCARPLCHHSAPPRCCTLRELNYSTLLIYTLTYLASVLTGPGRIEEAATFRPGVLHDDLNITCPWRGRKSCRSAYAPDPRYFVAQTGDFHAVTPKEDHSVPLTGAFPGPQHVPARHKTARSKCVGLRSDCDCDERPGGHRERAAPRLPVARAGQGRLFYAYFGNMCIHIRPHNVVRRRGRAHLAHRVARGQGLLHDRALPHLARAAAQRLQCASRTPQHLSLTYCTLVELADVPPKFCHDAFTFIAWSTTFAIVVTDMILVLRTWALWGGRRAVFFSLAIFLVAVATADSVIVASWIKNTVFIRASDAIPILHGCVIKESTNHVAYGWIVLTTFELVIVILTLIKGFEHFRMGHSNLITSLYRDGVLYFVYLFALSLCNMIFIFTSPKEYTVLFGPMQRSFNAILSCKIVMHLQSALSTRPSATGGAPTEEISTGIGIGAGSTARNSGTRVVLLGRRPYAERSYTSEWFGGTSTVGG